MIELRYHRIFWLAAVLAVLAATGTGLSDPPPTGASPQPSAILHPPALEFSAYLEKTSSEVALDPMRWLDEGWGFIPPPLDLSRINGSVVPPGRTFPARFDLRSEGRVSSVQSQGLCRSDWAFAVYSSLESSLLPGTKADFSEAALTAEHGFDIAPCGGGNEFMAIAYLARGEGAAEDRSGLPLLSWIAAAGRQPGNVSLQEALFVPDRSGPLDNDNLKWAVTRYGAVYTTMYWQPSILPFLDPYYSNSAHSYCYLQPPPAANHAVTIVGWDDTYDRKNFRNIPPGDGAFIVKNTGGTLFGEDGYTYVSYYDTGIGRRNLVFSAAPVSSPTTVYQHDPLGWTGTLHLGDETDAAWYANIYTAQEAQPLSAVGFYTTEPQTEYRVFVHLDPDNGPINQTGHARSRSGVARLPGYHVVDLDPPVPLTSGGNFSVVIRIRTPIGVPGIPAEVPIPMYSSRASSHAGESFTSSDGRNWLDLALQYPGSNVCIKAFSGIRTTESLASSPQESSPPPQPGFPRATVMRVPITIPPPPEPTATPTARPTPTPRPYQYRMPPVVETATTPPVPLPANDTGEIPTPVPTFTPTPAPTPAIAPDTPPPPTPALTPEPTIAPAPPQPSEEKPTKKPKPERDDRGGRGRLGDIIDRVEETLEPSDTPNITYAPTPEITAMQDVETPPVTATAIVPPDGSRDEDDERDDGNRDDDDDREGEGRKSADDDDEREG